ncbi:guanylate kinase [Lentimicrobium sp.]
MNSEKAGKLVIVSAPSGAGKTTIVKHLLQSDLNLGFSISVTNRPKREGETEGQDYYFVTTDSFLQLINNNELLEWQEVYPGSFYGTLKSEVDRLLSSGKNIIFDVDVVGGLNIKKAYQQKSLAVFIRPPSLEVLAQRLRDRHTDSNEVIERRLAKAGWEMEFAQKFDVIIVNNDLQQAKADAKSTVEAFLIKYNKYA